MSVHEVLAKIQADLAVPKSQFNEFGGYKYRNAEGIIKAYKELAQEAVLTLSDEVHEVCGQIFVTATARLTFGDQSVEATGSAMHSLTKKGMDAAQITGACSSYARKYALGGLFAIDDSQGDPDGKDNSKEPGDEAAWFKQTLPQVKDAEGLNVLLPRAKRAGRDVAKLLVDRANELGLDFDPNTRSYRYIEELGAAS